MVFFFLVIYYIYIIEYKGGYNMSKSNDKPWEQPEFADFLNDLNQLATDKYGWNVVAHNFETDDLLELIFQPALGSDSLNRKF